MSSGGTLSPDSYWQNEHDLIDNMNEHFFELVRDITRGIRRGQTTEYLDIKIGNCEESDTIMHDETLLAHLKEFGAALGIANWFPDSYVYIDLSVVQLPLGVLDLIKTNLLERQVLFTRWYDRTLIAVSIIHINKIHTPIFISHK